MRRTHYNEHDCALCGSKAKTPILSTDKRQVDCKKCQTALAHRPSAFIRWVHRFDTWLWQDRYRANLLRRMDFATPDEKDDARKIKMRGREIARKRKLTNYLGGRLH